MPGWRRSPTEGQSLHVHLYTAVLQSKWQVPYFFPKSHLVFSAEKQHLQRAQTASAFAKLKASLSQSVTSCPPVLWFSKPSCRRGLLEHPLPTALPNHYSVSRGMRSCWVPGRKCFWKAKTISQLLQALLVSGGVLGWLSGAKDLAPKDKNLFFCLLWGSRTFFNSLQLL